MSFTYTYTPLVWPFIASATVALALALYSFQRRHVPGAKALGVAALLTAEWATCACLGVAGSDVDTKLFWSRLEFIGVLGIPVAYFATVLRYVGWHTWFTPRRLSLICLEPALTFVLLWTNDFHGLMDHAAHLGPTNSLPDGVASFGIWCWVYPFYTLGLIACAIVILIGRLATAPALYRHQTMAMIAGIAVPTTVNALWVASYSPVPGIDVTSVGAGVSCVILAWAIFRFRLFDLVPVARDVVFENMTGGFLVIDARGTLVDINPAARAILRLDNSGALGQPIAQVLAPHPELARLVSSHEALQIEVRLSHDAEDRFYEITRTPLANQHGPSLGALIMLHDATKQRLAREALTFTSFHDPLTGLYNRAYFQEELCRRETGRYYPITLVCADIDGLKIINDTLGHAAGDDLIKAFASLLQHGLRRSDVIARLGGDEFAMVLPLTDKETAATIYGRLETLIERHNQRCPDLPLRASWGSETASDPTLPLDQAFQMADLKMYHEKLRHRSEGHRQSISTLLGALEARYQVEPERLTNMRNMAVQLAENVGLSRQEISELAIAIEVRDIGHVSVPMRVFLKENPLDHTEWEDIKSHPVVGAKIASSWPELAPVASIIRHHHEWWDGHGYPDGLAGDRIPIACRIIALVDAYDAMIQPRPYRPALTSEQALAEIEAKAGTQFDPHLAPMFVSLVRAGDWAHNPVAP